MKKKSGCFGKMFKGVFLFFLLLLVVGMMAGDDEEETASATSTPRQTVASLATTAPTTAPTEEAKKPLEFTLYHSVRGAYGQYYTMNENNKNASAEDKETFIRYFVPAGTYTVTNKSKYPTFVYIYSKEHIITSAGWEEPADCWVSEMLQPGGTCDVTVKEGYYIELHDNNVFKFVQK